MKKTDKAVTSGKAKRKQLKAPAPQQQALRPEFYQHIAEALRNAQAKAYRAVNSAMVDAYWNIGRMIVEEQQQGRERAAYGAALIKGLSMRLTKEFGKGFDERELRKIRQFYLSFPIRDALRPELAWTHYRLLIRVEKPTARTWYMQEAADRNWSTRALQRQINSLYYDRLRMSADTTPGRKEGQEKTTALAPSPRDFIKDPEDNPTVGIILCTDKDQTVVKYSILEESQHLFAAKYQMVLPTEEELQRELERERDLFIKEQEASYVVNDKILTAGFSEGCR